MEFFLIDVELLIHPLTRVVLTTPCCLNTDLVTLSVKPIQHQNVDSLQSLD